MTMAVLVGMTTGAMMLSSFATSKQNAKAESSQVQMNDDWKKAREGVAYCDGDTGQCLGTGDVWVNLDTSQAVIKFRDRSGNHTFDLTEYTRKDGYNYRFWNTAMKPAQYCYVYINIGYY